MKYSTHPTSSYKNVGMTEVNLTDSRRTADVVFFQHTQGVIQRSRFVLLKNEDGKFLKQVLFKVHPNNKWMIGQQ